MYFIGAFLNIFLQLKERSYNHGPVTYYTQYQKSVPAAGKWVAVNVPPSTVSFRVEYKCKTEPLRFHLRARAVVEGVKAMGLVFRNWIEVPSGINEGLRSATVLKQCQHLLANQRVFFFVQRWNEKNILIFYCIDMNTSSHSSTSSPFSNRLRLCRYLRSFAFASTMIQASKLARRQPGNHTTDKV